MAGAGSGKTRVLTHRIAYLVKELGIPLSDILAVTFTNKAAKEMKERVAKLLDDECVTTKMWVSTIHSLCLRILKRCMDLVPPFTKKILILLMKNDSKKLCQKKVLKDLEINNKYSDNEIKSLISKEKEWRKCLIW
ncbi:MAG: UvrD-helicase domain-containing protein [Clostridium sp.]|nr:MAG: UvrD-helicase domain-containing protein [Clostridium sp.]